MSQPIEPAPAPTDPPAPAPNPAATPPAPKPADDNGKGSKDAILADLAKERDARQAMEATLAKVAAAFGVETKKGKTDLDLLTERVAAQEERAAKAEARAMRAEVAAEKKLPPALAARLVGTTKEELSADADALLALLPQPAGETPAKTDPAPTGETPPEPPKPNGPAPDPSQGPKGTGPTARPTSLFDAISKATAAKR